MDKEKYWILINRYLSNDLSKDEIQGLLKWLAADAEREDLFNELGVMWRQLKDCPEVVSVDTREGWKKLRDALSEAESEEDEKPARYREMLRRAIENVKAKGFNFQ